MKVGIFKAGSLTYGMADLIVENEDVYYFLTLFANQINFISSFVWPRNRKSMKEKQEVYHWSKNNKCSDLLKKSYITCWPLSASNSDPPLIWLFRIVRCTVALSCLLVKWQELMSDIKVGYIHYVLRRGTPRGRTWNIQPSEAKQARTSFKPSPMEIPTDYSYDWCSSGSEIVRGRIAAWIWTWTWACWLPPRHISQLDFHISSW